MNLSEIKAAPTEALASEPLPEGLYDVVVLDAEPTTSKKGTDGVALKMEVLTGRYKGRLVWDRLWLTPKAKWRVVDVFAALGFDLDAMGDEVSETVLIGRRAAVMVAHRQYVTDDGLERTSVDVAHWGPHPDGPGETRPPSNGGGPLPSDDLPFDASRI